MDGPGTGVVCDNPGAERGMRAMLTHPNVAVVSSTPRGGLRGAPDGTPWGKNG
jgi:hypothetical protein